MATYDCIRQNEFKFDNITALRFLPEEPKLEWEIEREDGITTLTTEDYIPYVSGTYSTLLLSQRLYYIKILSQVKSSSKFPSGWPKKIETDILNFISDMSEHLEQVNKQNDNSLIGPDFIGFGDSLEKERCLTKVEFRSEEDNKIRVNILNSANLDRFCNVRLHYFDDVFLGLILCTKNPNPNFKILNLKKEFEGVIGNDLRRSFLKFLVANIAKSYIELKEDPDENKKFNARDRDLIMCGLEVGVDVIYDLFDLSAKYFDL